ncbi:hypothetical protein [Cetobacterium somerae]|uniref:hypothetical protein n=1 Tax=Cetobacterium somerae TaxID=188913 RepID=UPI003891C532
MERNIRKILATVFLMACFTNGYGEDTVTIEQLNILRERNMISQEDYDILVADLTGTLEDEQMYKLNVNSILIDNRFKVLNKGEQMYFPLFRFIDLLGFFNTKNEKGKITASLNEGLSFEVDTQKIQLSQNQILV